MKKVLLIAVKSIFLKLRSKYDKEGLDGIQPEQEISPEKLFAVFFGCPEIQDLIGARTLSKSGMDLLSRVGVSKFMGLDIVAYLEAYSEFINPIFDNNIPNIDQKTPRIVLDF